MFELKSNGSGYDVWFVDEQKGAKRVGTVRRDRIGKWSAITKGGRLLKSGLRLRRDALALLRP